MDNPDQRTGRQKRNGGNGHDRAREAQEVISLLENLSLERYVPPYAQSLIYVGFEDGDVALHHLERALEMRDVHLFFLTVDPKWDPLRSHPRFQSLLQACGFAKA